jgi:DNA-binding response OmpR family regulator
MKKILVVDDEPHVSMIPKQFLERANYQVTIALNGQQALDKIAQEMPDLLITDVQMPKMNGIQLCEIVNRDYPILNKLIIIMTSRTDNDIRVWAEPHSHIELMEKPVSMRRLTARLNEHFSTLET